MDGGWIKEKNVQQINFLQSKAYLFLNINYYEHTRN